MNDKTSKYRKGQDGEADRLSFDTTWKLACCDCGLVHDFQFHKVSDNEFDVASFRNNRSTGQLRRHKWGYLQQEGRLG